YGGEWDTEDSDSQNIYANKDSQLNISDGEEVYQSAPDNQYYSMDDDTAYSNTRRSESEDMVRISVIREATPVDVEYEQDDKECSMNRRSPSLDLLPPSHSRSSVMPMKKKPLVSNPFSSSPTRHPALYNVGKMMSPVKGLNYTFRDRMTHSSVLRRGLFGTNRQAPSGHRGSSGR